MSQIKINIIGTVLAVLRPAGSQYDWKLFFAAAGTIKVRVKNKKLKLTVPTYKFFYLHNFNNLSIFAGIITYYLAYYCLLSSLLSLIIDCGSN